MEDAHILYGNLTIPRGGQTTLEKTFSGCVNVICVFSGPVAAEFTKTLL